MVNSEKPDLSVPQGKDSFVSKELSRRRVYLSRLKRRLLKHVWLIRVLIVIGLIVLFWLIIILAGRLLENTKASYYFSLARNFVFTPEGLVKQIDGRTNILILGKGGEGHEAPDLTDTIIFVSLDNENKKISMVSLPRDIWLPELRTKLNSVYYWGNKKEEGGGIVLAKASVEEILGEHVDYAAVLDFNGFIEIIDILGGVEVDVETAFIDEKFPIPGKEDDLCDGDPEFKCRYETLHFVQGRQVMNGDTALKFARSRNAEGDEGTDFARQKRQQKIIGAVKTKLVTKAVIFSPRKILDLKDAFLSNLETDLKDEEGAILARKMLDSKKNISSYILPEDFLVNPPKSSEYDNLYVFVPKNGDWTEVENWANCVLDEGECFN